VAFSTQLRFRPRAHIHDPLLADNAEYRPELLLGAWPDVPARAAIDPVMAWKVLNLRKRLEGGAK